MQYEDYIKTEPINFINWDMLFETQELDEINKYYQLIEEKIKNNEYYVQDHQ